MDLISLLVVLLIFGIIFWLVDQLPLSPPPLKLAVRVIVVLILLLYLLRMVGLWSGTLVLR